MWMSLRVVWIIPSSENQCNCCWPILRIHGEIRHEGHTTKEKLGRHWYTHWMQCWFLWDLQFLAIPTSRGLQFTYFHWCLPSDSSAKFPFWSSTRFLLIGGCPTCAGLCYTSARFWFDCKLNLIDQWVFLCGVGPCFRIGQAQNGWKMVWKERRVHLQSKQFIIECLDGAFWLGFQISYIPFASMLSQNSLLLFVTRNRCCYHKPFRLINKLFGSLIFGSSDAGMGLTMEMERSQVLPEEWVQMG
jgi:hypothetical protein